MAGPNLYPGPLGTCKHCGQKTLVRLGSMIGPVGVKKWEASEDLVRTIYEQIREISKDGGGYVKTPEGGKYVTGKIVVCQRTKYCRRRSSKGRTTAKLIWVSVDAGIGEMSDELAGPFCGVCWPDYKKQFEYEDGKGYDFPIYYVISKFENLQLVFEAPEAEIEQDEPDDLEVEPEEDKSGASEVDGLF